MSRSERKPSVVLPDLQRTNRLRRIRWRSATPQGLASPVGNAGRAKLVSKPVPMYVGGEAGRLMDVSYGGLEFEACPTRAACSARRCSSGVPTRRPDRAGRRRLVDAAVGGPCVFVFGASIAAEPLGRRRMASVRKIDRLSWSAPVRSGCGVGSSHATLTTAGPRPHSFALLRRPTRLARTSVTS